MPKQFCYSKNRGRKIVKSILSRKDFFLPCPSGLEQLARRLTLENGHVLSTNGKIDLGVAKQIMNELQRRVDRDELILGVQDGVYGIRKCTEYDVLRRHRGEKPKYKRPHRRRRTALAVA